LDVLLPNDLTSDKLNLLILFLQMTLPSPRNMALNKKIYRNINGLGADEFDALTD
jgi:hypothetical protein